MAPRHRPASRIPIPAAVLICRPGSSQGLLTGIGLGVSGPISNWNATPYIQTWNFGVQKQIKARPVRSQLRRHEGHSPLLRRRRHLNFLPASVESASSAQITALNTNVAEPFLRNHYQSGQQPVRSDRAISQLDEALSAVHRLQRQRSAMGRFHLSRDAGARRKSTSPTACRFWARMCFRSRSTTLRRPAVAPRGWAAPRVCRIPITGRSSVPFRSSTSRMCSSSPTFTRCRSAKASNSAQSWNGFVDAVLGGWQTNGFWRFDDGMPLALSLANSRPLPDLRHADGRT